jgi:hypothetical protein
VSENTGVDTESMRIFEREATKDLGKSTLLKHSLREIRNTICKKKELESD